MSSLFTFMGKYAPTLKPILKDSPLSDDAIAMALVTFDILIKALVTPSEMDGKVQSKYLLCFSVMNSYTRHVNSSIGRILSIEVYQFTEDTPLWILFDKTSQIGIYGGLGI